MEAMVTAYCEEANRRMIQKLEVYGGIPNIVFCWFYMDWMFRDERDCDSCTKGG